MGSRIRDGAAAVHEAAAALGFVLKKEQEKVIVAFTQGHDVFVALPAGFGQEPLLLLSAVRFRQISRFHERTYILLWW